MSAWTYARQAAAASGPFPLPRASPLAKKMVVAQGQLARVLGKAPPLDVVNAIEMGGDPHVNVVWDLLCRGVRANPAFTIIRNSLSQQEWQQEGKDTKWTMAGGDGFKVFHMADDVSANTMDACKKDLSAAAGGTGKMFLLDYLSLGVRPEARVLVMAVTDDARVATFLTTMLPRVPKSFGRRHTPNAEVDVVLCHSSNPDADASGKPYLGVCNKMITGRGKIALDSLMSELATTVGKDVEANGSIVLSACDARLNQKTSEFTLVLGAPTLEKTSTLGELHGAHHMFWNAQGGVSRMWDGFITESGFVSPLKAPRTILRHPKRLSIVLNPSSTSAKPVSIADAKTIIGNNTKFTNGTKLSDKGLEALGNVMAANKALDVVVFE